ncbi:MAG: response regulator [Catalinimonas sp.]
MLIDDNRIDNFINRKLLQVSNFAEQFFVMESGREALTHLQTAPVLPNVILLDVQMPEMDGFAFLDALDALNDPRLDHICLYMLSSSIDQDDLRRARRSDRVRMFLSKPLNPRELLRDFSA